MSLINDGIVKKIFMNQLKRINRILDAVENRIQQEVGELLGADFVLDGGRRQLVSKEDAFESLAGKQICARMDISGEITGKSCLLIGIKDAIRLGGTLIMLPTAELKEVIGREEYSDEIEDSYGEIANIIAGSFTTDFEELYPHSCRFVRKEQEVLVPTKIDIAADTPIADGLYYQIHSSMALEGQQMGQLVMLLPAATFELQQDDKPTEPAGQSSEAANSATTAVADTLPSEAHTDGQSAATGKNTVLSSTRKSEQDVKNQQKKVDKVLAACRDRMVSEVGALLGTEIKLNNLENFIVGKKQFFFDEVSGKQVIANMDVVGEPAGQSYLSVGLRDAIRIGGTLIMLPSAELDAVAAAEDFSADTQDAFSEIANIIAGVYTTEFEELFTKQIRLVKKGLQQVAPMKVDVSAAEPFADQDYYLSRMDMTIGAHGLGKIQLLFPAELLHLGDLRAADNKKPKDEALASQAGTAAESSGSIKEPSGRKNAGEVSEPLDILVVGDDELEVRKIAEVLQQSGYVIKILSYKDSLHGYLPGKLKAIYLVMREVNEQAFGIAIKVSSACSVPLIAAGPGWTRKKVIKAVKYGVRDILLTPAGEEDIRDNLTSNLLELAA